MEEKRGKDSGASRMGGVYIALAAIAILVVLAVATISIALPTAHSYNDGNRSYSNGNNEYGMMSGNGGTDPVYTINNTSFNRMNSVPPGVLINNATNTINVTTGNVTLLIEAAPTWYPRSGDFWFSYGLINPNISVKQGTNVHFIFINMDNITHMPAITTLAPPYSYMPMENSMMGSGTTASGMMGYQGGNNGAWLAIGPMLSGTDAQNHALTYSVTNLSVTFNNPGSYWYICLVPGHAEMGMYGNISVHN